MKKWNYNFIILRAKHLVICFIMKHFPFACENPAILIYQGNPGSKCFFETSQNSLKHKFPKNWEYWEFQNSKIPGSRERYNSS